MKLVQSCLTFATPRTVARQDPLSTGFSGQEYWCGLPFPSPENLPENLPQGLIPGLLHCRQTLYHLSHQRNDFIFCRKCSPKRERPLDINTHIYEHGKRPVPAALGAAVKVRVGPGSLMACGSGCEGSSLKDPATGEKETSGGAAALQASAAWANLTA